MLIRSDQNGERVVVSLIFTYNAVNTPVGVEVEPKSFIIIVIGKLGKPHRVCRSNNLH